MLMSARSANASGQAKLPLAYGLKLHRTTTSACKLGDGP